MVYKSYEHICTSFIFVWNIKINIFSSIDIEEISLIIEQP